MVVFVLSTDHQRATHIIRAGNRVAQIGYDGTVISIRQAAGEILGDVPFRAGQQEAIDAALLRDVLAVLPTGGGKSLVYRVVGRLFGGVTVVVSPTVALQADQLAALRAAGPPAAALNSLVPAREQRATLEQLADGTLAFVLLAPEQLQKPAVLDALVQADVRLFAVDEAHCVSTWGQDFRPDYLHLPTVIDTLGRPRVLALTATASPTMRREIVAALRMRDPAVIVGETDRPNIWLGARVVADDAAARDVLTRTVAAHVTSESGAALVYVGSRRRAEETAAVLTACGLPADAYHGTLPRRERDRLHRAFHRGDARLIVATSAFGLGVDKPDVRLVAHLDPPEDLDDYYQQIGRAGRDGRPAEAVLLSRPSGYQLPKYFAARSPVDEADLRAVWDTLASGSRRPADLAARATLSAPRVRRAVNALVGVDAVRESRTGVQRSAAPEDADELIASAVRRAEHARTRSTTGVELMRHYAETTDCRRRLILQLLGEERTKACGNCDNCDAGTSRPDDDSPFAVGTRVIHREGGTGIVQQHENDRVVVLFESAGYRTLSTELALDSGLLAAAR